MNDTDLIHTCIRTADKIKDLYGHKFGKLTAIKRLDIKSGTSYMWLCRCECGNVVNVSAGNLKSGQVKSCGCLIKDKASSNIRNMKGNHFGKLTVIEPTEKRADGGSVVWRCKCDCGNYVEISRKRLLQGSMLSCGCHSNEVIKDYIGKKFGRLTVVDYSGKINLKSTEHYWLCKCECGNFVNVGQTELQNGDTKSCGCFRQEVILDSLKLINHTSVTGLKNSKKLKSNNKSGFPGVFQEKSGKWIAYINFQRKRYWLGRYAQKEEAIRARIKGEEMHDDFLDWYYSLNPSRSEIT